MPPLAPLAPRLRAALTVALSLAVFMNILDLSIANVAIPTIAGDLGVSTDNGTYVITSFAVSAAIAMPLTGWLARRFGELRTFLVCTASFTAASLLCGLAPDLQLLIALRAAQGLVAGPMIPLAQSLLLANYPEDRKNLALALLMMVTVAAPVLGPVLGGWLTDNWSWGWVFYVNVPVGIIATLSTAWLLRGRETHIERIPVDKVGIGLLALGVGSLQIMLDRGKDLDWFGSPTIVAFAIAAFVGLAFFVAWELTDEHPAVDLRLFAGRNFTVGTTVLCLGYAVFFGNIVLLPLWLQTQMGYTATWAGLATAPVGILPILLAPFIGRYMGRIDLRWWLTASFVAFAAASFWFAGFNTDVTFREIAWSRFAQGLGVACFFAPLNAILISGMPPNRVAAATGLSFTLRTLAGSFATSLTTTWWDRREALHQAHLTERLTAFEPITRGVLDQLHALGIRGDAALATIERTLVQQAYMLGTNDIFWLWGWILLGLIALTWLTRPPFVAGVRLKPADDAAWTPPAAQGRVCCGRNLRCRRRNARVTLRVDSVVVSLVTTPTPPRRCGRPDHDIGKELDMKSILDPSFEYTPSIQTDIQQTFARVWRELAEREEADADFDTDRDSLWLECSGELVDAGPVKIVGVRMPALMADMVEFVCPRCNQRHESLRFR